MKALKFWKVICFTITGGLIIMLISLISQRDLVNSSNFYQELMILAIGLIIFTYLMYRINKKINAKRISESSLIVDIEKFIRDYNSTEIVFTQLHNKPIDLVIFLKKFIKSDIVKKYCKFKLKN